MNLSDKKFLADIQAGRLQTLSHENHVRLAWVLLKKERFEKAIHSIRSLLQNFAHSKGKPEIFHETITWAFSLIIYERILTSRESTDWADFQKQHPDLFQSSNLLDAYYSSDRIESPLARRHFLLPDKILS